MSEGGVYLDEQRLRELLQNIKNGSMGISEGVNILKDMPFTDLGYANIDNYRELRVGYPEVIYGAGKTIEQIKGIVCSMLTKGSNILITRVKREVYDVVHEIYSDAEYFEAARIIFIKRENIEETQSYIAVVTAGTSDIPVAEEAAVTASVFGNKVERIYDVGVAGIHRLFAKLELIRGAKVIIVIAGMEGALASVVGGLVDKPVIAVPTSVGYGSNFGGLSALLSMLNSCSGGVSVVNIDNGFGAGYLGSMINRL